MAPSVAGFVEASKEPLFSFHLEHPSRCALQVAVFQAAGVDNQLAVLVFPRQGFQATQQRDFRVVGGLVNVQN